MFKKHIDKTILCVIYLISFFIVFIFPINNWLFKLSIGYLYIMTTYFVGYIIGYLSAQIISKINK